MSLRPCLEQLDCQYADRASVGRLHGAVRDRPVQCVYKRHRAGPFPRGTLAVATDMGRVLLYGTSGAAGVVVQGEFPCQHNSHSGVFAVDWLACGTKLVLAGGEGLLSVHDLLDERGTDQAGFSGHSGGIRAVSCSPNEPGESLVLPTGPHCLTTFRLPRSRNSHSHPHPRPLCSAAVFASAARDGKILLWDVRDSVHGAGVSSVALSRSRPRIFAVIRAPTRPVRPPRDLLLIHLIFPSVKQQTAHTGPRARCKQLMPEA